MAKDTPIEWCHRRLPDGTIVPGHSFNRWWGCLKVSEECFHCYAEGFAKRVGRDIWGPASNTERWILKDTILDGPRAWNEQARKQGHRRNVFCSSMSDIFEENSELDVPRAEVWELIEQTPWLNWLLLTKRPENMIKLSKWGSDPWPNNIWAMTSVGMQKYAEPRISKLLEVQAVIHGISVEPLLEQVNLSPWLPQLDWIIVGGESGPGHRRFDPAWARDVRDQVLSAQLAGYSPQFFFKQHGGRTHAAGGRLLDGVEWNQMPPEFNYCGR